MNSNFEFIRINNSIIWMMITIVWWSDVGRKLLFTMIAIYKFQNVIQIVWPSLRRTTYPINNTYGWHNKNTSDGLNGRFLIEGAILLIQLLLPLRKCTNPFVLAIASGLYHLLKSAKSFMKSYLNNNIMWFLDPTFERDSIKMLNYCSNIIHALISALRQTFTSGCANMINVISHRR